MPVKRSTLRDQPSIVRKPALRMQMNSRKFHCPFFSLFSLFSSLESPYPSSRRVGNLPRGGGGGGDAQGRARRLEYLVERWPSRELLAFYRKRKRASCKRILCNITELHCPPRLSEKKKRGGDAREPRAMAGISRPDYISPARTARRVPLSNYSNRPCTFPKLSYRILLPPAHCKFKHFILEHATLGWGNLAEQRGSIEASSGMLVSKTKRCRCEGGRKAVEDRAWNVSSFLYRREGTVNL